MPRILLCGVGLALAALSQPAPVSAQQLPRACTAEPGRQVLCIKPSATDPAITHYDRLNYVTYKTGIPADANLLVFLPGTGGAPPGPVDFLKQAAEAGYRTIALDYNDEPSVAVYCPRHPPGCSAQFRRMRLYGESTMDPSIDNTREESILNRLVKLLQYLQAKDPAVGWNGYLTGAAPNWGRIALAGQSQGAGMAAFLAKQHLVARVILFSSPWDFIARGGERQLAPWITQPGRTPAERWFGGYHARENMADLLAQSYRALGLPADHIRVFTSPLRSGEQQKATNANPFHPEGIRNPAYAPDRAFFLGRSPLQLSP